MEARELSIDTERLINDLIKMRHHYEKSPRKDDLKNDYTSFVLLNQVLGELSGLMVRENGIFYDRDKVQKLLDNQAFKSCDEFCNFLETDLYDVYTILYNFVTKIEELGMVTAPYLSKFKRYNYKDFKDIILDYYSSFGEKEYKIAKKYFDEKRIHLNYPINDGAVAYYLSTFFNKSGYIILKPDKLDSYSMLALVHELGHAIDYETLYFQQGKKRNFLCDYLIEVPSTFFELGLTEFLKKNKIDEDGAYLLKQDTIAKGNNSFFGINDFINERYIYGDVGVDINGNSLLHNGEIVNVKDDIFYGMATYLALYLHSMIKGNYDKEFMKKFYTFLATRRECSLKDSLDILGINYDEFVSADMILSDVEENNSVLKKKYNLYGDINE